MLLDDSFLASTVGKPRDWLFERGAIALPDALGADEGARSWWRNALAWYEVAVPSINGLDTQAAQKIPGLTASEILSLLEGQPYILETDLASSLGKAVSEKILPFVALPDYSFMDKVCQRTMRLDPQPTGYVIVWGAHVSSQRAVRAVEELAGTQTRHLPSESISLCPDATSEDRRGVTRMLNRHHRELLRTIAPYLTDQDGLIRIPHPFRLELRLNTGGFDALSEGIVAEYRLDVEAEFAPGYFLVQAPAPRHDLSALYDMLERLDQDPRVIFAEPHYLEHSP